VIAGSENEIDEMLQDEEPPRLRPFNTKRRRQFDYLPYLLLFLGLALVLYWQSIPIAPSKHDIDIAKQIVSRRTAEKICGVQVDDNGVLEISTRWMEAPLEGGGHTYYLRRFFGMWWLYKTDVWNL
jgi:H+/Cl- antiporter ClcA